MPSFLNDSGLGAEQIGNVFVLISLATLISAPSWGRNADKYGSRSKYLTVFPLIAAAIMAPLILFPGYYQAICIALVQGALIVPLVPLADAVCIERCRIFGWKYGRIRLWGTVGFLATSSVGGFLAESLGWGTVMLLMLAIVCLMAVGGFKLEASLLPKVKGDTEHLLQDIKQVIHSRRGLILRPFVLLFLGGTILYQTAFGAYNLFFGINLEHITHASKWISIAWAIATISEILFFGVVDSLMKKTGPVIMMGIAMACAVLRWGLLSYTTSLPLILTSQILHGVMLGGFVTGAVTFSSRIFPSKFKTFAQGLHNAAYNGLGGALAALTCSHIFSVGGAHAAFRFSAIVAFMSILCLALGPLLHSRKRLMIVGEASNVA